MRMIIVAQKRKMPVAQEVQAVRLVVIVALANGAPQEDPVVCVQPKKRVQTNLIHPRRLLLFNAKPSQKKELGVAGIPVPTVIAGSTVANYFMSAKLKYQNLSACLLCFLWQKHK